MLCLKSETGPEGWLRISASCLAYTLRGKTCQLYKVSPSGVVMLNGVTWFSVQCQPGEPLAEDNCGVLAKPKDSGILTSW